MIAPARQALESISIDRPARVHASRLTAFASSIEGAKNIGRSCAALIANQSVCLGELISTLVCPSSFPSPIREPLAGRRLRHSSSYASRVSSCHLKLRLAAKTCCRRNCLLERLSTFRVLASPNLPNDVASILAVEFTCTNCRRLVN